MTRGYGRIAAGVLVVVIGILWLLRNMGIISLGFIKVIAPYWPVGLILIGLCIIFRCRELIGLLSALTIILAIVSIGDLHLSTGPVREIRRDVGSVQGIGNVDLGVSYAAGKLGIARGSGSFLDAKLLTSDVKEPVLASSIDNDVMDIRLERKAEHTFWNKGDEWQLGLSPDVVYSITMDYGAADAMIDLTGLKVSRLEMDTGATKTTIVFADYPTKVDIDTGASSLLLKFPKDASVVVKAEHGVSSFDMPGFRKDGESYYSRSYAAGNQTIDVRIKAGASSIRGEFY